MRRTSRSLVRVATAIAFIALCVAPAHAGSDYLLVIGGIEGETSTDKRKDYIEILSYSWGATRARDKADVVAPRDAASGLPTGKRQHKPVLSGAAGGVEGPMKLSAPLAKGSLTVRGKFPQCAVGTRYPSLALSGRGKRYTLQDAIITNCGTASGEALPMEEVSFNYAKIKT